MNSVVHVRAYDFFGAGGGFAHRTKAETRSLFMFFMHVLIMTSTCSATGKLMAPSPLDLNLIQTLSSHRASCCMQTLSICTWLLHRCMLQTDRSVFIPQTLAGSLDCCEDQPHVQQSPSEETLFALLQDWIQTESGCQSLSTRTCEFLLPDEENEMEAQSSKERTSSNTNTFLTENQTHPDNILNSSDGNGVRKLFNHGWNE